MILFLEKEREEIVVVYDYNYLDILAEFQILGIQVVSFTNLHSNTAFWPVMLKLFPPILFNQITTDPN